VDLDLRRYARGARRRARDLLQRPAPEPVPSTTAAVPVDGGDRDGGDGLLACLVRLSSAALTLPPEGTVAERRLALEIRSVVQDLAATLGTEQDGPEASAEASWHRSRPQLPSQLLTVGRRAVDAGMPELAIEIARTVLAVRPRSGAALRLLASAAEAELDDELALSSWSAYLALPKADPLDVPERVARVERRYAARDRLVAEARRLIGPDPLPDVSPVDLWLQGLDREAAGDAQGSQHLFLCLLVVLGERVSSPSAYVQQVEPVVRRLLTQGQPVHDRWTLVDALGDLIHSSRFGLPGAAGAASWPKLLDAANLRAFVRGKSVCLVANSSRVRSSGLGSVIDGYDIVVRFNSYAIDAPNTGARTDIHATIHLHPYNWRERVPIRLVFSGDPVQWQSSVRRNLDPGAQEFVSDRSLRWPIPDPRLVGDETFSAIPTSGFNVMRLLDFLGGITKLDLIGFDFYEGGIFRLDEAMHQPVATAHDYAAERAWVMEQAVSVTDDIIALR
jgi:hypothetical protein